jgi:hypothetical protein
MIVMILSGLGRSNDEATFGWLFFPHWLLQRWEPGNEILWRRRRRFRGQ